MQQKQYNTTKLAKIQNIAGSYLASKSALCIV